MSFASIEASFRISQLVKDIEDEDETLEEMSISKFAKKFKKNGCITEALLRLVHKREVEELAEILEREDCSLERLSLRDETLCCDLKQFFEALWSGKYSLCSLELVDCKLSEDTTNMMVGPTRCRLRQLTLKNVRQRELNLRNATQGVKELIRRVPMLRFFTGAGLDAATIKVVAEAIREGYCVLETLTLYYISEAMYAVVEAIGTRVTQLRSLNLFKSRIGNEGANSLAQAIMRRCCPFLEELYLVHCKIEVEGICSLGEAIGSTVTILRSLHLSYNKVGEEGSKSLAEAITNGACVLRELHLWEAQIGSEGICSIAKALTNGHSDLHTLDLSENVHVLKEIANKSDYDKCPKIMPIIESLKSKHCRLRKLLLNGCGIRDKEMNLIVDILCHTHCKLKHLEMILNDIEDKGVQKLANALQTGQCLLQNLDLTGNNIGWEGIKQLGDALQNAKSRGILKIEVLQIDDYNDDYINLVEKLDCLEDLILEMKHDASDSYNSEDIEEDEGNVIVSLSSSIAIQPFSEGHFVVFASCSSTDF